MTITTTTLTRKSATIYAIIDADGKEYLSKEKLVPSNGTDYINFGTNPSGWTYLSTKKFALEIGASMTLEPRTAPHRTLGPKDGTTKTTKTAKTTKTIKVDDAIAHLTEDEKKRYEELTAEIEKLIKRGNVRKQIADIEAQQKTLLAELEK